MQNEEQNSQVARNVKDRLFRFLFENDKENLLRLYNALNGTDYHDVNALQVVTIKNAVYITMKNDFLSEFLRKNRAEVLGMLLEEFDAEKYEKTIREEGREEGIEFGQQRTNKLTLLLIEQNRLDDLARAAEDTGFQNELFKEFGI